MKRLLLALSVITSLTIGTVATSKAQATECDLIASEFESYQEAQKRFGSYTIGNYNGIVNFLEQAHREYSFYEGMHARIPLGAFSSLRRNTNILKDWRSEERVKLKNLNNQLKELISLVKACL